MLALSAFLSIVSTVLSWFGIKRKRNPAGATKSSENELHTNSSETVRTKKERGKLFAEDEGEYVDFEEIK